MTSATGAVWGDRVYVSALRGKASGQLLRSDDGAVRPVPVGRWLGPATAIEEALLARLDAPILDVGCGPGRLVRALADRGVAALGIDESPEAVAAARRSGAAAVRRSIFDRVPAPGFWASALLLDGNIGIGGDPARLLRHVAAALGGSGRVLVEVDPPGWPTRAGRARLEDAAAISGWFPWAVVGLDGLTALCRDAGLCLRDVRHADARWFTELER